MTATSRDPRWPDAFRAEVRAHVGAYARPDGRRAWLELGSTVALFVACLVSFPSVVDVARGARAGIRAGGGWAAVALLAGSAALAVAIALVQIGTYVRLFLIHHDLVHGAFFGRRRLERAVAVVVGALCSTSPSVWQREHDRHHRDSNNLDREQDGQTASWTTARYRSAPPWHRRLYYLLNARWITFTVLPAFYFFGFMRVRARWYENAVAGAFLAALFATGRLGYFAATLSIAAVAGFLLFHLQHTFDGVYRRRSSGWDSFDNAMLGSSFVVLPGGRFAGAVLRWFSYGVEYHHVHHLSPRVAGYRLRRCHEEGGALFDACPRVTLAQGIRTTRYSLYDEERGRFESVSDQPFPWRADTAAPSSGRV